MQTDQIIVSKPLAKGARHTFFEQPQFECLLGDNLLQVLRLAPELLDLIGRRGPRRVAGEPALAGLQELLRPRVIHALGDAFAPTVSPRRPSSTMRIFSSAAWCFRVARRMLRTSVSDDAGVELDFCLIFAPRGLR